MIERVYQDKFGFGNGNCVAACVASLFGVPLRSLDWMDGYDGEIVEWTKENHPDLQFNSVDFCYDYDITYGYPDCDGVGTGRYTYKVPDASTLKLPEGYWMASVISPALERSVCDPYYPLPALHAVIYKGDDLCHDVNVKYKDLPNDRYDKIAKAGWWSQSNDR